MLQWLLCILICQSVLGADIEKTAGVPPSLLPRYVPSRGGTWRCLDDSTDIWWSEVNNDYCDCPDGSDEPGTNACENTQFYCQNEGHIGTSISSTRVNDGKCDPDCCDGSDERLGVCKNICKEVGEMYRKKRDAEQKIQKTGSKIRASYITFAQREKTRLENFILSSTKEIEEREKEVVRLKDLADRTESLSAADLEHKQQSPLYISLKSHQHVLKSLQHEHKKHLQREKDLGDILDALRTGFNPNYQDMAVLEAVRGWEHHAGLPHINDVKKDDTGDGTSENDGETGGETTDDGSEELLTAEELEKEIGTLQDTDYVSLLLEHDNHVNSPASESILFDLSLYIPDSLLPHYEVFRDSLVSCLQTLGVIRGTIDAAKDASRARKTFEDAEHSLKVTKDENKKAMEDLADLFSVEGFGSQGEWKKLDGQCLEKEAGEYTYELCLFDEARQKANRGGGTHSLGKFTSWNPSSDITPGEPEYYTKQVYQNGAKCWNGPHRSVVFVISCGTENAINSVVELEKCEYQFTGTSPALCLPLDEKEKSREEL